MAPEMLPCTGYGPEVDTWSCGVLLYRLLSREYPFPGKSTPEVFRALRDDSLNFTHPAWANVSPSVVDLLQKILEKDPRKRIHAQDILTHAWMKRFAAPTAAVRRASFSTGSTFSSLQVEAQPPFVGPGYDSLPDPSTGSIDASTGDPFSSAFAGASSRGEMPGSSPSTRCDSDSISDPTEGVGSSSRGISEASVSGIASARVRSFEQKRQPISLLRLSQCCSNAL